MPIDFSKIRPSRKEAAVIDPIDLFQRLKISDKNINDLWLAQGDALREWNTSRKASDVAITLNTGSGKTLVGLLIAQSLTNETRGKVLYACSSIQLVEQTRDKAIGYGLSITTYYKGNFDNTLFHEAKAPCITTYQALFNGRSIFFREEIAAVIFDDAHAAEHLLRDHFSLRISSDDLPRLHAELVSLFQECFRAIGKDATFTGLDQKSQDTVLLVPPSELHANQAELMRLLVNAGLEKNSDTMFAWEHIKDKIDICAVLATSGVFTFTPAFVPVQTLPYFSKNIRRVYLSATLVSKDAFARTFGCLPSKVVAPITTAGECERLILVPNLLVGSNDDVGSAINILNDQKTLILVPTYLRAKKWQVFAELPPQEQITKRVNDFKNSSGTPKMILAARYDGVDLPGDTCRVMIIDDLPMGMGPLERFLWESLRLAHGLRSTIASRIVQSFGRISRGMSDHGIVFLTGKRLIEWLHTPNNRATLPAFLQKQLELGFQISRDATSIDDLKDVVVKFFDRNQDWIDIYRQFMEEANAEKNPPDLERLAKLALSEGECAKHLWNRDYDKAAKILACNLNAAFEESQALGAWHALWLGRIYELMKDKDSAQELYVRAHGAANNIPALRSTSGTREKETSRQVLEIEQQFLVRPDSVNPPRRLSQGLVYLNGTGTSSQTEEALRALGEFLGLEATRPEKEHGTGPDVLWVSPGCPALCMEVKSGKDKENYYRKRDMGQLSDHIQWVRNNTEYSEIIPIFVGPLSKPSESANPSPEFQLIELDSFKKLGERLIATYNDIANIALPPNLREKIDDSLKSRQLTWPNLFETLNPFHLYDS